jgi:anthranilate phosphoribosyltransferase
MEPFIEEKVKKYLGEIKVLADLNTRYPGNYATMFEERVKRLNFGSFCSAYRMVKKQEDDEIEGYVRLYRGLKDKEAAAVGGKAVDGKDPR